MNFFETLYEKTNGQVDLHLRMMSDNAGNISVSFLQGSGSNLPSFDATGTPQQLDDEFFSILMPGVAEVKGLSTNLDSIKSLAAEKAKPAEKPDSEIKSTAKATAKKPVKKQKPVAVTQDMFAAEAQSDPEEQNDEHSDQPQNLENDTDTAESNPDSD